MAQQSECNRRSMQMAAEMFAAVTLILLPLTQLVGSILAIVRRRNERVRPIDWDANCVRQRRRRRRRSSRLSIVRGLWLSLLQ